MATLEVRGGTYRIIFYVRNQRFSRSLKTESETKALELKARLEGNLSLLEQGRLEYTPGKDDLPSLLLSDGRLNARVSPSKLLTLGEFVARYRSHRPAGLEPSTAYTEGIHLEHLLRLLGPKTPVLEVPDRLQAYIRARSLEDGRGSNKVRAVTIRKELGTLSSIWNKWGVRERLVGGRLSLANLEYEKGLEKAPFQTWEQIEARGDGWESLYLSLEQVAALLEHVREAALHPFALPMFVMAADTGARRSEMIRSRLEDFDLPGRLVRVREKKRIRGKQETFRHVPMTDRLRGALEAWLAVHPGGGVTFCTTKNLEITPQLANHHLRWTLDGSRWGVIRGWHTFRHTFISNLASAGIDQRIIMQLAGHMNEQTTRRYSHLFPSTVHAAMNKVFGGRAGVSEPG